MDMEIDEVRLHCLRMAQAHNNGSGAGELVSFAAVLEDYMKNGKAEKPLGSFIVGNQEYYVSSPAARG